MLERSQTIKRGAGNRQNWWDDPPWAYRDDQPVGDRGRGHWPHSLRRATVGSPDSLEISLV